MNLRVWILFSVLVFLGFSLFFLWKKAGEETKSFSHTKDNAEDFQDQNLYPLGNQSSFWEEALSPFRENQSKSYLEILEDLSTGKINFVWEVWALRRKCDSNYTAEQCDALVLRYIESEYESPEKEKVLDLFQSYFKYEAAIQRLELPYDLSFEDRYEKIQKKRREILGEEKSNLFFGMEEAQVTFLESSANFIKSSKDMPPDLRVKEYNALKKKTYGSFYQNMVGREDIYENYQQELALREKEFPSHLNTEEREKKLFALESKYFGKEKAKELAKNREEEFLSRKKLEEYDSLETKFLKQNQHLTEKERERKILELRKEHLGEDAEAYGRRKAIESLE